MHLVRMDCRSRTNSGIARRWTQWTLHFCYRQFPISTQIRREYWSASWRDSLVVRASDLRLDGRKFNLRPLYYRSVGTGTGDRLRAGIPSWHVTSHSGQLSLLPSVGREMSTGQSALMRCGWEVKAEWLIPLVDKRVGLGGR